MRSQKMRSLYRIPACGLGVAALAWLVFLAAAAQAVPPGQVSWTAQVTSAYRALGAKDPDPQTRNPDYLAARLVDQDFLGQQLYLPADFAQALATLRRRGNRTFFYITARTKYIDQVLAQEAAAGARQVVILGTGLDSRPYRFQKQYPGLRFFEVDLPATLAYKRQRVEKALGAMPAGVAYVAVDFDKDDLGQSLARAGYRADQRTLFIWEGVTYYLQEAGVRATLKLVAKGAHQGSRLVFDYLLQEALDQINAKGAQGRPATAARTRHGEPFLFGIKQGHSRSFLAQSSLSLVEELDSEQMVRRFLTSSQGQAIGRPSQGLRLVLAEVPAPAR
ncbi:MAG: SAM-dependent methyltransferase [Thermodesulfobacteriota bacterium]